MISTHKSFQLTLLAAALTLAFGPAKADESLAEFTKPDSFISIGAGNWSKDRPQQGIYDGMRDSGAFGLLDADINKRDDQTGTWIRFKARNLGLETRELRGEYTRQGDIGGFIDYSRTPRDNPYTFNTGLQGIGTTTLGTSNTGLRLVELGTKRDLTQLGFYKNLMPGLELNISFKNEEKSGTRQWGQRSAASSADFAVEPIDSTTNQFEVTLNYTTERLQLAGGYYGSWYDNSFGLVSKGPAGLAATDFVSLPLNNQAHQLYLDGGYSFTPTTRGTFKLSYTHATQDERLPTQDIAGLSLPTSPKSLDGELNTTLVQLGLTSKPIKDLSVVANVRYHDLQDDTPVNRFVQQVVGGVLQPCGSGGAQCVDNTPWSYKTLTGKLEGTYRLAHGYSVSGGVEHKKQDRTVPVSNNIGTGGTDNQRVVPFRAEIDETTYRVEARKAMSETINGSVAFLRAERDGSAFSLAGGGPGGAPSDLINPIHIADRDRNKWRLAMDWAPIEQFSLQFAFENSDDKYGHDAVRKYGVRDGDSSLYSVDADYRINDKWQVTAWYSHDKSEATQFGRRDTSAPAGSALADKEAKLKDVGDSIGIGVRGSIKSNLRVGADAQWTRNESKYPETLTTTGAGTVFPANFVGGLPDVENKLAKLSLFAAYAVQKNAEVRVDYIHERWKTDDWTWLFSNGTAFTYSADGTVVTQAPKQVSNFVGVRYIYKFQ